MASKSDFSTREWELLRDTPHWVVVAVASAGASGLLGSIKEAIAPAGAMIAAAQGDNALLRALCQREELKAAAEHIREQAKTEGPIEDIRAFFSEAALSHCRRALALLKGREAGEDAEAYADFLIDLAERVANAAKEGGFLGFGGERVSDPEKAFLAELAAALGRPTRFLEA